MHRFFRYYLIVIVTLRGFAETKFFVIIYRISLLKEFYKKQNKLSDISGYKTIQYIILLFNLLSIISINVRNSLGSSINLFTSFLRRSLLFSRSKEKREIQLYIERLM